MKLPEAVKTPGRFSLLLSRAGDEESSVLYAADVKLLPEGKRLNETNADHAQVFSLPEGGGRIPLKAKQLKTNGQIYHFAQKAFALGRLSLIERAFTAVVILRDVYEEYRGEKEYMAVRYEGCALIPTGNGAWELLLRAPGTLGTLIGNEYVDLDDCFEEGWPYDE